jgi:murein DD-endopeptidase MepM/ murein hydrolase activator NlpD
VRINPLLFLGTVCALMGSGCADRQEPPAPIVHPWKERAVRRVPKPTVMPQKLHVPQTTIPDEKIVLRPPAQEISAQETPVEDKSGKIVLRAAPVSSQENAQDKNKALPKASDDEYGVEDSMREVEGEGLQDTKKTPEKKSLEKQKLQPKQGFLPEKPPGKDAAKKAVVAPKGVDAQDGDDDELDAVEEDEVQELTAVGVALPQKNNALVKDIVSSKGVSLPQKNLEGDLQENAPKAAPKTTGFSWPLTGAVLKEFSQDSPTSRNDGLNIAAALKAPIKVSKPGTVVYIGNDIKGFGNLVLVKHDGEWMTAYAHLDSFNVAVGDALGSGQVLGYVGRSGGVTQPQLHFEVRKNSTPVDPRLHLKS